MGAAFMAGSILANAAGAQQQADARNAALNDNATHQAGYDATIAGLNNDALSKYAGFSGSTGTAQTGLANLYKQGVIGNGGPQPPSAMPQSTSAPVAAELAKQTGIVNAKANGQADTQAALQAPGLALRGANIAAAPDFSQIGQQDNFKTGYAGTLPLALDAASQQGGGYRFLGDVLSGLNSIGNSSGMPGSTASVASGAGKAIGSAISTMANPFPFGIP